VKIDTVLTLHGVLDSASVKLPPPPPITNFKVVEVGDGYVELSWSNPDYNGLAGVKIQRKTGGYPASPNDGETAYDGLGNTFIDNGLPNDIAYYYRAFPYSFDKTFNTFTGQQVSATPIKGDDPLGIGGLYNLVAGDMDAGYFGRVTSSGFIDGDTLASQIGLSAGTSQYSNEPWLKFAYQGRIQFVAKKAFRHSISWNNIANVGAVFGDGGSQGNAQVIIGGLVYKVRLMSGSTVNPLISVEDYKESEWNKLMLPIHKNAPDNWTYPTHVNSPTEDWGINYSDEDLLVGNTLVNGGTSWTQETQKSNNGGVSRGIGGIDGAASPSKSQSANYSGWRPVLELVL
jgi:hypothetical protein